jgi:hypothetical protein
MVLRKVPPLKCLTYSHNRTISHLMTYGHCCQVIIYGRSGSLIFMISTMETSTQAMSRTQAQV